ncbi:hypothetical protein GR157_34740 [Burkholderia sp. 4701]|nr:hypothetical protein [Burkholderia sp. 4701]MXN86416.1 hypothetical protein [Burkholderia sp. 4812]
MNHLTRLGGLFSRVISSATAIIRRVAIDAYPGARDIRFAIDDQSGSPGALARIRTCTL